MELTEGVESNEKFSLNKLLKRSVSDSMWTPPMTCHGNSLHSPSQQLPTSGMENEGMANFLQKQKLPFSTGNADTAPACDNAEMSGTARQYFLLASNPNEAPHIHFRPTIPAQNCEAPCELSTSGSKIQLGQTYRFNIDKQSFKKANGIVLKPQASSPSLKQNQRYPLPINDRGKFIPFSQLLPYAATTVSADTGTVDTILHSGLTESSNLASHLEWKNSVSQSTSQRKLLAPFCIPVSSAEPLTERQPLLNEHPLLPVERSCVEPFDWDEYLKITKSMAAPHSSFKHVEISLHNGFNPGMKLEVANKSDPTTYWVATLISTCGSLLLLRYDGYGDDRKMDFWADVCTADLHPIGWCAQNGKILQPPEAIKNMHENWAEFLVGNLIGARTAPERLLNGPFKGKTVVEMIEPGMLLEVQDSQHPQHVWMVDVLKNIGGRLLLRYKGLSDIDARHDFWLFYLDARLHQVGWGKEHRLTMKPPDAIRNKYKCKEQWAYVLSQSLKGVTEQHLVPACVFQDQVKLKPHNMKEGYKLSVLDPIDPTKIRPATVIKLVDQFFFLAELDNLLDQSTSCAFLCHSGSSGIFSVAWCIKYEIPIASPHGYDVSKFDWNEYLKYINAQAAPDECFSYSNETHQFKTGMKLEACSPYNLYEICVAMIVKIYGNVLHLRLAASLPGSSGHNISRARKFVDCLVHSSSQDIFPVGWCHSNNYPLSAPTSWREKRFVPASFAGAVQFKKVAVVQPKIQRKPRPQQPDSDRLLHNVINPSSDSKFWCPVVCVNYTCRSGGFLNDDDLSKVPRFVGPGNTVLVLKEVLTLLVAAAERPHKLLRDLEDFTLGRWDQPCVIKTKFEGKKYQATLHIVNSACDVPPFFKSLSQFLKCCPNLLSLEEHVVACPLDCKKQKVLARPYSARGKGRRFVLRRLQTGYGMQSRSTVKEKPKSYVGRPGGFPLVRRLSTSMSGRYGHRQVMKRRHSFFSLAAGVSTSRSIPNLNKHTLHINMIENLRKQQGNVKLHKLNLQSNPLLWSAGEVAEFIETTDCSKWSKFFLHNQIDGQAFLLLTLPVLQECMNVKLGPSLKIARHVERVKMAFYENFSHS